MQRKGEIPRREWSLFFRTFAAKHHGHICSVALVNGDKQMVLQPLLLEAVGPEATGSEDGEIRVVLADWFGEHMSHIVRSPRHIFVHRVPEEVSETLEIDGAGGRTMMRFEAAC